MQGAPVEGARVPPDSLHFMSWTVPKEALHGVRELSSPTQRTPSPAPMLIVRLCRWTSHLMNAE